MVGMHRIEYMKAIRDMPIDITCSSFVTALDIIVYRHSHVEEDNNSNSLARKRSLPVEEDNNSSSLVA